MWAPAHMGPTPFRRCFVVLHLALGWGLFSHEMLSMYYEGGGGMVPVHKGVLVVRSARHLGGP
jgi:hypothetical protein